MHFALCFKKSYWQKFLENQNTNIVILWKKTPLIKEVCFEAFNWVI